MVPIDREIGSTYLDRRRMCDVQRMWEGGGLLGRYLLTQVPR